MINAETLKQVKKAYKHKVCRSPNVLKALTEALDEVVGDSNGVQSVSAKYSSTEVFYADMGDPYTTTILAYYSPSPLPVWIKPARVMFKIGNWGDLIESGRYE